MSQQASEVFNEHRRVEEELRRCRDAEREKQLEQVGEKVREKRRQRGGAGDASADWAATSRTLPLPSRKEREQQKAIRLQAMGRTHSASQRPSLAHLATPIKDLSDSQKRSLAILEESAMRRSSHRSSNTSKVGVEQSPVQKSPSNTTSRGAEGAGAAPNRAASDAGAAGEVVVVLTRLPEEEHLEWGVRIAEPSMQLRRVEEGTIAHMDGRLQGCFGMLVTHANDAPISRLQECGRKSINDPGRFERLWSRCTTLKLQLRPEGTGEPSQG
eukprot:gene16708-biopygen9334